MNLTTFISFLSLIVFISLKSTNGSAIHVHRTAYHFQPLANWMSDPNGPMFYRGVYHLFYQYNPEKPIWEESIVWAHSVSTDLVNWEAVEPAIVPSKAFDGRGTWSGSATILPDRGPVILYTGQGTNLIQAQNYVFPSNLSDPYLREWTKPDDNPIIIPDATVNSSAFRDPSTAWWSDGYWRTLIGSRQTCRGVIWLYRSKDFFKWEKAKHPFDSSPGTGNWECPDFFPVAKSGSDGLDLSHIGDDKNVEHVLKISLDWKRYDYYTIGTFHKKKERYVPYAGFIDGLQGLRCDYGNYYASKSFFDEQNKRRITWGFSNESDSKKDDLKKGWLGIQTIPRTVLLDPSGKQLVFWPVREIERLRGTNVEMQNEKLALGSKVEVTGVTAAQADVEVVFSIGSLDRAEPFEPSWTNAESLCEIRGSHIQGGIGPFGLITLATSELDEYTPVFFRVFKGPNNKPIVLMCSDAKRSTLNEDTTWYKPSYGGFVDVDLHDNKISLRSLIDHSVVESFGAKGKVCITSRVYPEKAVLDNARLYVFNNGSEPITVENLTAWDMKQPTVMNNNVVTFKNNMISIDKNKLDFSDRFRMRWGSE